MSKNDNRPSVEPSDIPRPKRWHIRARDFIWPLISSLEFWIAATGSVIALTLGGLGTEYAKRGIDKLTGVGKADTRIAPTSKFSSLKYLLSRQNGTWAVMPNGDYVFIRGWKR